MKLYFDSLTTLKVIYSESPIVIFFGTYGIWSVYSLYMIKRAFSHFLYFTSSFGGKGYILSLVYIKKFLKKSPNMQCNEERNVYSVDPSYTNLQFRKTCMIYFSISFCISAYCALNSVKVILTK